MPAKALSLQPTVRSDFLSPAPSVCLALARSLALYPSQRELACFWSACSGCASCRRRPRKMLAGAGARGAELLAGSGDLCARRHDLHAGADFELGLVGGLAGVCARACPAGHSAGWRARTSSLWAPFGRPLERPALVHARAQTRYIQSLILGAHSSGILLSRRTCPACCPCVWLAERRIAGEWVDLIQLLARPID